MKDKYVATVRPLEFDPTGSVKIDADDEDQIQVPIKKEKLSVVSVSNSPEGTIFKIQGPQMTRTAFSCVYELIERLVKEMNGDRPVT